VCENNEESAPKKESFICFHARHRIATLRWHLLSFTENKVGAQRRAEKRDGKLGIVSVLNSYKMPR
jgi:hypothetical protein